MNSPKVTPDNPFDQYAIMDWMDQEFPYKSIPQGRFTPNGRVTNPKAARTKAINHNSVINILRFKAQSDYIDEVLLRGYKPTKEEVRQIANTWRLADRPMVEIEKFLRENGFVKNEDGLWAEVE
jgi:hypothetical protein